MHFRPALREEIQHLVVALRHTVAQALLKELIIGSHMRFPLLPVPLVAGMAAPSHLAEAPLAGRAVNLVPATFLVSPCVELRAVPGDALSRAIQLAR